MSNSNPIESVPQSLKATDSRAGNRLLMLLCGVVVRAITSMERW